MIILTIIIRSERLDIPVAAVLSKILQYCTLCRVLNLGESITPYEFFATVTTVIPYLDLIQSV